MNLITALHTNKRYKTYLQENFKWHPQTLQIIDWQASKNYMKTLNTTQSVRYIKLTYKLRKINKKIVQTGYEGNDTPLCTLRGIQIEDDDHPYMCTHLPMREA